MLVVSLSPNEIFLVLYFHIASITVSTDCLTLPCPGDFPLPILIPDIRSEDDPSHNTLLVIVVVVLAVLLLIVLAVLAIPRFRNALFKKIRKGQRRSPSVSYADLGLKNPRSPIYSKEVYVNYFDEDSSSNTEVQRVDKEPQRQRREDRALRTSFSSIDRYNATNNPNPSQETLVMREMKVDVLVKKSSDKRPASNRSNKLRKHRLSPTQHEAEEKQTTDLSKSEPRTDKDRLWTSNEIRDIGNSGYDQESIRPYKHHLAIPAPHGASQIQEKTKLKSHISKTTKYGVPSKGDEHPWPGVTQRIKPTPRKAVPLNSHRKVRPSDTVVPHIQKSARFPEIFGIEGTRHRHPVNPRQRRNSHSNKVRQLPSTPRSKPKTESLSRTHSGHFDSSRPHKPRKLPALPLQSEDQLMPGVPLRCVYFSEDRGRKKPKSQHRDELEGALV